MVDRRTFTTLLVGGIAAPKASFAQNSRAKSVFYSAVGPGLTLYGIDVDNAALVKRDTVSLPGNTSMPGHIRRSGICMSSRAIAARAHQALSATGTSRTHSRSIPRPAR